MRFVRVTTFAVLLFGLTAVSTAPACSVFNDCNSESDPIICESATSYSRCIGGEGQYHRLSSDCPAEQTCDASRGSLDTPCVGRAAGGSCSSHSSCEYALRCLNGTCTAPSPAAVATCNAAPGITIGSGESIDFDLVLSSDVAPFEPVLGATCHLGRVGLFRIVRADLSKPIAAVFAFPIDAKLGIALRSIMQVHCDDLFNRAASWVDHCTLKGLSSEQYFEAGSTFLVAFDQGVDVNTVRMRLETR